MAENTSIAWCDHTFNPWWGCEKVHEGCTNCYAETFAKRTGKATWGQHGTRVKTSDANWLEPLKWNRKAECIRSDDCANGDHSDACPQKNRPRVFCASMADIFENWSGPIHDHKGDRIDLDERAFLTMDDCRADLFRLIDATSNLNWLLLTKRPENVRRMWQKAMQCDHPCNDYLDGVSCQSGCENQYRSNCWLGTSVSNQSTADEFVPRLLECRSLCPVLFLSCEPLLGPINLSPVWNHGTYDAGEHLVGVDWIIVGGESGGKARPCRTDWIRSLVNQCDAADVPCFVKQLGSKPLTPVGRVKLALDSKGGDMKEWPSDLRVRQFPTAAVSQ